MKTYLVGGAIRDMQMGKEPQDRDYVVVGATPEHMLAEGFEQVGASFPVFLHPETGEEFALARTERKVGEGYLGFETVTDGVTIEDDLSRRDFTINAMAMHVDMHGELEEVLDPFGGLEDLRTKTLRHVGPAFSEDPLRVVRLARFLARLPGFTVADETFLLAQKMVRNGELNELPWERFAAEIVKVLETCTPHGCFTFFDVLDKLDCSKHVTFFAGVNLMKAAHTAQVVKLRVIGSMRPSIFAALAFDELERCERVGGSLGRSVQHLLMALHINPASSSLAYDILQRSGAWKNSPTWTTLLATMWAGQSLGRQYALPPSLLVRAEAATKPFDDMGLGLALEGVPGKEIGARIKAEKMEALYFIDLE